MKKEAKAYKYETGLFFLIQSNLKAFSDAVSCILKLVWCALFLCLCFVCVFIRIEEASYTDYQRSSIWSVSVAYEQTPELAPFLRIVEASRGPTRNSLASLFFAASGKFHSLIFPLKFPVFLKFFYFPQNWGGGDDFFPRWSTLIILCLISFLFYENPSQISDLSSFLFYIYFFIKKKSNFFLFVFEFFRL